MGMVTAVVAAVGVVATVLAVAVELFGGEFLAVAKCSCSGVRAIPFHPSSYVSGTLVGVVAAAVVAFAVQLFSWEFLAVAWRSFSGVRARPLCLSNFVSGTLSVGRSSTRCPYVIRTEAAALGASESALLVTVPAEALHTLTLDSGASRCFFRDSTTLTPLSAYVPVRLADPSRNPVLARSSTVLPCPADAMVTTTTPRGQRVSICTCKRTGRHLTTFTRQHGSSLYTLATEPPEVAASAQVFASGQVAPPCSCRLLSHQTLLWHHRLGHPSLPRLRGMHSRLLVSSLPRSLPPLPHSPAPPCLPCIEGRQRPAPHSSSIPSTVRITRRNE
ncbi:unnamed protein product [Closterium sp. NIES-54]